MAKKEYSLDYNIETDAERLVAVDDILRGMDREPLSSD